MAWKTAVAVAAIELLAVGCFAGAMACGIMESTHQPQTLFLFITLSPPEALLWSRGFVGWGYTLFIAGIIVAMLFCYQTLRSR